MLHVQHSISTPPHERHPRQRLLPTPTRLRSKASTCVEAPWQHMTQAYTWVVEEENRKGIKSHVKAENWVREQQYIYNLKASCEGSLQKTPKHRREEWEDLVYTYGIEAERWMKEEERARRVALEREKARVRIQEELRRIEARFQHRRYAERREREEAQCRAYAEQRQKENRHQAKLDNLILGAWDTYEKRWTSMTASSEPLDFKTIPWPLILAPRNLDDITLDAMVAMLFSPLHSQNQSRKDRIRTALLRWHPDRFRRYLRRVSDKDQAIVEEGVGIVARCLNELMEKEKSR